MTTATATAPATKATAPAKAKATAPRTVKAKATAPTAPANPVITPEEALELRTAELVAMWRKVDTGETQAKNLFDEAKLAWENARVVKVRVAYQIAMLKPYNGEANLAHATRVLKLTDEDMEKSPADIKAKVKKMKSSLANYIKAGVALAEAGLVERTTEPDKAERDIVRDAFKSGNARPADNAPAGGEGGEGDAPAGDAPADDVALTFNSAVLAHLAKAHNAVDVFLANGGKVTDDDMELLTKVMGDLSAKLAVAIS